MLTNVDYLVIVLYFILTAALGFIAKGMGGFATFVLAKYVLAPYFLPWDMTESPGKEWAWTFYTGLELLVAFGLFFLEGFISRPTPEEQAKVDELFAQLAEREPVHLSAAEE